MPFITQGKTNWKFIAIVVVLAVLVGGGILFFQYFWPYLDFSTIIRILFLIIILGIFIWYKRQTPEEREKYKEWWKKHPFLGRIFYWGQVFLTIFIVGLFIWVVLSAYFGAREKMRILEQPPAFPVIEKPAEVEPDYGQSTSTEGWQTYRNEEYGFELILPEGWEFSYREEFRSEDGTPSIVFNFIPPGEPSNILWGSLYLTVYPYQPDINKWIEKYLHDFENELVIEEINRVGNKPTFLLDRKEGFWIPWHVILGNEYSYSYEFSQDGALYFVERIIEEIFPHINIK